MALNEQLAKRIGALEQQARKRDVYERHIPYCVLSNQGAKTFTTATWTVCPWALEYNDVGAMFDAGVNTDRVYVVVGGLYSFRGAIGWTDVKAGTRQLQIRINGTIRARVSLNQTGQTFQEITLDWHMSPTDYAELWAYQNSGGDLAWFTNNYGPMFSACLQG